VALQTLLQLYVVILATDSSPRKMHKSTHSDRFLFWTKTYIVFILCIAFLCSFETCLLILLKLTCLPLKNNKKDIISTHCKMRCN